MKGRVEMNYSNYLTVHGDVLVFMVKDADEVESVIRRLKDLQVLTCNACLGRRFTSMGIAA